MSSDRPPSVEPFAELLAQARRGQSAAMGQLLEVQRAHLVEMARRRIPQPLQARMAPSDAVQVTLMSAHRHFNQFRGDSPAEFSEWLLVILLNTIRDFLRAAAGRRKQHVNRVISLDALPAETRGVACQCRGRSGCDLLIEQETTAVMRRCVELLPEPYRQVLKLRFADDRGFAEIGSLLGISPAAARKMRSRAVQAIAALMQTYGIIEEGN
jgi:RNA polymerase sigma-70 factor (ECF subfamily)